MKNYLNPPLFPHILVCLLSTILVTDCNLSHAQGKIISGKKIAYATRDGQLSDHGRSRSYYLSGKKIAYGARDGQLSDHGRSRSYYLYTPKSYHSHRPMPLVLVFHGHGGSGRSIAHVSRFNNLAEQQGFIVAYPDGIGQEWSLRANSQTHVDDVSFVTTLIDHLQQIRNIDSHRIYATGFSKGAILAQALACQLPDKIAAFGSVAGALPVRLKPNCQPRTSVSMLMINGTKDQSVHYQGDDDTHERGALISVPATVNFWRTHDGCPSSAQVRQIPDSRSRDRFKVKIARYSSCKSGSEVLLASVVGGGHFWPGGASTDVGINKLNTKLGFNASKTTWNFFQRHSLP